MTVFTPAVVRALLVENVVRSRQNRTMLAMPDDAAIDRLAGCLHGLHAWTQHEKAQREPVNETRLLLGKSLDRVETHLRTLSGLAPENADSYRMMRELVTMMRYSPATACAPAPTWRTFARALAGDFDAAMRPANPGMRGGIGHDGPLARFIAAVVPILTGEHPAPGTVTNVLKDIRRAGFLRIDGTEALAA